MLSLYNIIRQNRYLNLFAINLRYLIGFAFIPSGVRKIVDMPFVNPGAVGPFAEFLHAFYNTGFYYNVIGWAQVIAGVLLMTQRFATIGTFIFLPIIFNISVFTWSTEDSLTHVLAALILLGTTFLLMWDLHKWKNIFAADNKYFSVPIAIQFPSYNTFWIVTGIILLASSLLLTFYTPIALGNAKLSNPFILSLLIIMLFAPVVTFILDEVSYRKQRRQLKEEMA